ncbi:MAG: precorrin-6A reductase [Planctomycetes bacterium]|nr:precorrin-6A reductase [Planctomycetota bacterium]
MKTIALFAGTTEGRAVAQRLAELPVAAIVCVATGYGAELLDGLPAGMEVRVGRLDADGMASLFRQRAVAAVVDATHPYATQVSENIAAAANLAGIPALRLARQGGEVAGARYCVSLEEAVETVNAMDGNILLATGSNRLDAYTAIREYASRCYVRVLPTVEAIEKCERLGYKRSHIIAMQGPFSRALNVALFQQFAIAAMVTKDSGKEGGFDEKILAAAEAGVEAVVIGRPPQADGMQLEQILEKIAALAVEDETCA